MGSSSQSEGIHVVVVELGPVCVKRYSLGEQNSAACWRGNGL